MIYITHLEAAKLGLSGIPRAELPSFWPTFFGGAHFLIPLGLLITLLVRQFSPELAAFWAIVALTAYAASAIAKSNPIKTGIQGFIYDLRTAILPFMFFFNTELLLINVHSPFKMGFIFLTALLAMFAFASALQGWCVRKNRWYEAVFFMTITWVLLRPGVFASHLGIVAREGWQAAGVLVMILLFAWQWGTRKKAVATGR